MDSSHLGGGSHQAGRAAVPDISMGEIRDAGGEVGHLRLGSLGSASTLYRKFVCFFIDMYE